MAESQMESTSKLTSSALSSATSPSTAESVRLNFARIRKGDWKGWYEGTQGMLLADLLNFAGRYDGDDGVTKANWFVASSRILSTGKKAGVALTPHPDRSRRHSSSGKGKVFISDVIVCGNPGVLATMKSTTVLHRLVLHCGGGGSDGLGSSCQRVSKGGWCSGIGSCEGECTWDSCSNSQLKRSTKLQHMCAATIVIDCTVASFINGARRMIQFNVDAHASLDWKGVPLKRQQTAERSIAMAERLAHKPHSGSDVAAAVKTSPTVKKDSRNLKRSSCNKLQQDIRRATSTEAAGDWEKGESRDDDT